MGCTGSEVEAETLGQCLDALRHDDEATDPMQAQAELRTSEIEECYDRFVTMPDESIWGDGVVESTNGGEPDEVLSAIENCLNALGFVVERSGQGSLAIERSIELNLYQAIDQCIASSRETRDAIPQK